MCDLELQVHAACGLTYTPNLKSHLEVHVIVLGPHGGSMRLRFLLLLLLLLLFLILHITTYYYRPTATLPTATYLLLPINL